MSVRPINDTPTSPYAVLGVSRHASAEDIKRAYHRKAKEAHPDAGGSEAAMEKINQAYQILSSPLARREYDAAHDRPARQPSRQPAHQPSHEPNRQARYERTTHAEIVSHRRTQARAVATQMLARSLLTAAFLGVLTHLLLPFIHTTSAKWLLLGICFGPFYLAALAIVFLIDPDIRLRLFDLTHHRSWRSKLHLLRLICLLLLPAVPLIFLWIWLSPIG